MSSVDDSFEGDSYTDVNTLITEYPTEDADDVPFAAKKLQSHFDDVASVGSAESSLKVYLRVRPTTCTQNDSTIQCISDTEILTIAPDVSNRAKYTKTEERHYVRIYTYYP